MRKGAVGSNWVEEGRRRSSTWSRRPAAVWTAAAPFQWVGAVVEGSGSTSERRGTRFRRWLGSREGGGRGSAAAYGGAAAMAPAGGFWTAAGARVVFECARGESGEVMVLLGAKEEEKELGCGRKMGGGQSVDGGELRRARGVLAV